MARNTTNTTRRTTSPTKRAVAKKSNLRQRPSIFNKKIGIILVVAFAAIGVYFLIQSRAETGDLNTFAGQATAGLDNTGKTIPTHDYPVPTTGRVIFMSPKGSDKDSGSVDGNDANSGLSESAPVETITAAYNKLRSNNTTGGGTIVLRGGKYRSWHKTSDGTRAAFMDGYNITFQAYRSEKPWFVGTDAVDKTSWEVAGTNLWRQRWDTPNFCKSHLNAGQVFEGQEIGYRAKIPGLVEGSRVKPITSGTSDKFTPYTAQSGIAMRYVNSSGVRVDTPRVCAHPDSYYTNPTRPVEVDSDPQMVYANDTELPQRKTLAELTTKPDSFFYDWDNQYVYVNKDPNSNSLEITRRHAILNFSGGNSFQWKGIGVKRFASSPLHAVIYAGLGGADVAGGELIVEKSVFSENSGATVDISGPKNSTALKNSVFARNKYAGFGSNGFASRGDVTKTNKLLIDGSIFNENNYGLHDTACGASCGVAGTKLNNMVGYTVKNSIFENTKGRNAPGLWCDIDCSNGVMVNNILRNNTGPGIFYEISSKGIIAGNLVYHNDFANIKVLASTTKIYNNTIINKVGDNVEAVWVTDDSRPAPDKGETWPYTVPAMQAAHASLGVGYAVRVGPNTNGVEFANNLVVSQKIKGARLMNFMNSSLAVPPNTTSPEFFRVMSNNIYYRLDQQPLYGWLTNSNIQTVTDFKNISNQGWELNTIDVVGTGDPFVSRDNQDFRLKTDSQAYLQKGLAIPSDVATAMGVTPGALLPRGAQFPASTVTPPVTTDTTAPVGPTTLTATPASTSQINLTWPAATDNVGVTGYQVYRNGVLVSTVAGTSFANTGLAADTTYQFQVKAKDAVGLISNGSSVVSAKTNAVTVTPPVTTTDSTPPTTPTGMNASLVFQLSKWKYDLALKWTASTDNVGVTGYQVYRDGVLLGVTGSTTFTDRAQLQAGRTYTYTVHALDAATNKSQPASVSVNAKCTLFVCSL